MFSTIKLYGIKTDVTDVIKQVHQEAGWKLPEHFSFFNAFQYQQNKQVKVWRFLPWLAKIDPNKVRTDLNLCSSALLWIFQTVHITECNFLSQKMTLGYNI